MKGWKSWKAAGVSLLCCAALLPGQEVFEADFAENLQPEESVHKIAALPVGSGNGKIAYTPVVEEMELRGPESFAVSADGKLYILDTIDHQIEIFDQTGRALETIDLPHGEFHDIELQGNQTIYTLKTELGEVCEFYQGQLKNVHQMPVNPLRSDIVGLFHNTNDEVVVRYLDGSEIALPSKEKRYTFDGLEGKKVGKNMVFQSADESITVEYTFEAGGTYPLQRTEDGTRYVLETEVLIGKELYVETRVEKFKGGKSKGVAIALPTDDRYYTKVPQRFIYVNKNGDAYQMVSTEKAVEIYALDFQTAKKTNITKSLIDKVKPQPIQEKVETPPAPPGFNDSWK